MSRSTWYAVCGCGSGSNCTDMSRRSLEYQSLSSASVVESAEEQEPDSWIHTVRAVAYRNSSRFDPSVRP